MFHTGTIYQCSGISINAQFSNSPYWYSLSVFWNICNCTVYQWSTLAQFISVLEYPKLHSLTLLMDISIIAHFISVPECVCNHTVLLCKVVQGQVLFMPCHILLQVILVFIPICMNVFYNFLFFYFCSIPSRGFTQYVSYLLLSLLCVLLLLSHM